LFPSHFMPQITLNITHCFHLKITESTIVIKVFGFITAVGIVCCGCWYNCVGIKTTHMIQVSFCLIVIFFFMMAKLFEISPLSFFFNVF
jgi:hypothetical protein